MFLVAVILTIFSCTIFVVETQLSLQIFSSFSDPCIHTERLNYPRGNRLGFPKVIYCVTRATKKDKKRKRQSLSQEFLMRRTRTYLASGFLQSIVFNVVLLYK